MGTISRSVLTDDSGDGLDGSIINNAEIQKIYDAMDNEVKSAKYPNTQTKEIIDIVKDGSQFLPGNPIHIAMGSEY